MFKIICLQQNFANTYIYILILQLFLKTLYNSTVRNLTPNCGYFFFFAT